MNASAAGPDLNENLMQWNPPLPTDSPLVIPVRYVRRLDGESVMDVLLDAVCGTATFAGDGGVKRVPHMSQIEEVDGLRNVQAGHDI